MSDEYDGQNEDTRSTRNVMDSLADAVRRELPEHLSKELQATIARKDELEERCATWGEKNKELEQTAKEANIRAEQAEMRAREALDKVVGIEDREAALVAKERDMEIREAVLKVKEDHAKERVDELRGVVERVFANNQYKYHTLRNVPCVVPATPGGNGSMPMSPYVEDRTQTETVEGEG